MTPSADFVQSLSRARRGESAELDALFDRFYPTVRRRVHQALATDLRRHRPWLASLFSTGDVVQEVFYDVLRDLESFEGTSEAAFIRYLTVMIQNRLVDAVRFHEAVRRDRRRHGSFDEDELTSSTHDPAADAVVVEEIERFHGVLMSFPTRERLLLQHRLERAETFRTLAPRLGYPSSDAARKAFYTAQALLVIRLRQAGVRDRVE